MPTSPNLLAGLSNAPASTTIQRNNYASGYPIGNVDQRIQEELDSQSIRTYTFPSDLPRHHFVITENNWTAGSRILTAQRQFRLQLPTPLSDTFEVDYDQQYSYLGDLIAKVSNIGVVGAAAQATGAATGLTLNTYRTVTMSAPKYRSFDFNWKFSPKNFQESQEIRRITTLLRKGMSPTNATGGILDKLILRFPQIYTMHFFNNSRHLYKFKPCVLMALVVDYQGGNPFPGFYKGQETPPESIVMSTKWLELEYWLQQDINEDDGMPTTNPYDSLNYYQLGEGTTIGPEPTPQPIANDPSTVYGFVGNAE